MANEKSTTVKPVKMALGDVIRRLMHIEFQGRLGGLSSDVQVERDMLLEALNVVPVVVGFDCNGDNIPDYSVGLFKQAAATSCCRIQPAVSDRKVSTPIASEPVVGVSNAIGVCTDARKLRGTTKPRKRN